MHVNDERASTRMALVDALTAEHRLRRQALKEQEEAARWRQRVVFAADRGLEDLAASARMRAMRHERMANLLTQGAAEVYSEVQELRAMVDPTLGAGRAPPPGSLEAQFRELELEAELDRLRAAKRGAGAPPNPDAST